MTEIAARLQALGIELPKANPPVANYVPFVITGNLVIVSGQIPVWNGERRHIGKLGAEIGLEEGVAAARLCGLNLLAWVKAACDGDLDRVTRVVRLGGFVNSTSDFTDQPTVINGCSNLMADVFGPRGQHARAAVGSNALPFNVAVEIEGTFEIRL
jgi:enamine deaminase RidA (YjgF/YER057c/UK114 family)